MPTIVKLQNNFSFGLIPILFLFIILISPLFIKLIQKMKAGRKEPVYKNADEIKHVPTLTPTVKEAYIKTLRALCKSIDDNSITVREGYLQLSRVIREFVLEYEGTDVTKKTLAELRAHEMPELISLIEEYYKPEFSEESDFDYKNSIEKTIKVIDKWK